MRVLGLTRYANAGASSRLRSLQYGPALAAAGITVVWRPLFDDRYIRDLYERRRKSLVLVAGAYAKRIGALLTSRRSDLVWLEKESLPWLPSWLDPGLLRLGPPYVVDYDDAVFHYYDQSRSAQVRKLLGHKIDAVMRHAALVVAGNPYLAARARQAGARRVEIIPTVIDLQRYTPREETAKSGITVGWIGSPSTQKMIQGLVPVLARCLDPVTDRLVTVGARFEKPLMPNHEMRPWSEATEVEEIRRFDIGVMPLVDQPFERGKCGYKLIQYMACGVPVVASPVGVNTDIVQSGVNGFLAADDEAWGRAIRELKADAGMRRRMGAAGRALVERQYCLQVTAPRLIGLLQQVAASNK